MEQDSNRGGGPGLLRRLFGGGPKDLPEPEKPLPPLPAHAWAPPAAPGASAFQSLFGEQPKQRVVREKEPLPLMEAPAPLEAPRPAPPAPSTGVASPVPKPTPAVKAAAPAPAAAPAGAKPAPPPAPLKFLQPLEHLTPTDLVSTPGPSVRVLAIGSCFLAGELTFHNKPPEGWQHDFIMANGIGDFPEKPPVPAEEYDYQLIQIPLRVILPARQLNALSYHDEAGFAAAFDEAVDRLRVHLDGRMKFNVAHGLLTFVFNFMLPQFPTTGLLLPRYDLRNIEYFIGKLNEELERMLAGYRNAYMLDIDRLSASFGRRYVQDDVVAPFYHGGQANGAYRIEDRMEKLLGLGHYYDLRPAMPFRDTLVAHVQALYRAIRQQDSVKLVVTDLDDTLWKGVSGDAADIGVHMIEGWPYGYIEALQILRRRGILLAIASKNDETRIREIWNTIMRGVLTLEEFAAIQINWNPKAENMRVMLAAMNLLPRNVVFVDDNPAERAQMKAAFPEMRVIGANPYHTRRVLLMAAETQVAAVTAESARRTEMIQAQIQRETERAGLGQEEFARQQQVEAVLFPIKGLEDPRFARTLELINKTNQYNTTGKRWKAEEIGAFLGKGGRIFAFDVRDRYTEYGLVGVVLVRDGTIEQWVMSCRVLGTGVERSVLRAVVDDLRARGSAEIVAHMAKTEVNKPCHQLFATGDFVEKGETWWLPPTAVPQPAPYVKLETP